MDQPGGEDEKPKVPTPNTEPAEEFIEDLTSGDVEGAASILETINPAERRLLLQRVQMGMSGPIPPPWIMAQYAELDPNYPNRIFELTEREQAHQHQLANETLKVEKRALEADSREVRRGQYFGYSLLVASFVLAAGFFMAGNNTAGLAFSGVAALSSVVRALRGRNRDGSFTPEQAEEAEPPKA